MSENSGLQRAQPIVLAREKPFRLGAVRVRPAVRELTRDGQPREILEPKVMQVLVALARTGGEIVTRDDLTQSCWDGRIVGEDAITRVISRLRHLAAGIGESAFHIETITKVGYRLTVEGAPEPDIEAPIDRPATPRRALLIGAGAAAAAVAAGAGGWLWLRPRPPLDRDTQALYDQAWPALNNNSADQLAQAIGLLRRVVQAAPTYADGWGALAYAYSDAVSMSGPAERDANVARLRNAAAHALKYEAHNALAEAALAQLTPIYGNWLVAERVDNALVARHPAFAPALSSLSVVLNSVGRNREAARLNDQVSRLVAPSPELFFSRVIILWAAGRLEDCEHAASQGMALFPRNAVLWFTYLIYLMFTGRPDQAVAMIQDQANRPVSAPDSDFDNVLLVARAAASRSPADIDKAMTLNMQAAHQAMGYASNTLQFAAVLGRVDQAFEVAEAYYFGRGFTPEPRRFSRQAGVFYKERRTYYLFMPTTAAMRADSRFDSLVERIGLKAYWAQSGHGPDYRTPRPSP